MRDAFFLIIPIFFAVYSVSTIRIIKDYRTESRLVLFIIALIFIGPLMAKIFFAQTYLGGLLFIRHSLVWFAFFMFMVILRDLENVDRFLRYFTVFIGIWLLLLILTKYMPTLGIINVTQEWYIGGHGKRFGEFRLYFPYGDVPMYLYCIALASLLHGSSQRGIGAKFLSTVYVFIAFYAVTSTFTRILITTLLLVTLYALATCQRHALRLFAFSVGGMLLVIQAFGMAAGTGGIGLLEQSNLGKLASKASEMQEERGRKLQLQMYRDNFLRSPVSGVGNLPNDKTRKNELDVAPLMRNYRKYGFFNINDTGYPKTAAEYGLLGVFWLIWYFRTAFRRSRDIISRSKSTDIPPAAKVIGYGTLYFSIYLLISGVTLPHFILPDGTIIVALALAVLAIAYKSLEQQNPVTATESEA